MPIFESSKKDSADTVKENAEKWQKDIEKEYGIIAAEAWRATQQIPEEEFNYASNEFKELFDDATNIIDKSEEIPGLTRKILEAIENAAREKKWKGYDSYSFDNIRKALENNGLKLKPKKTGSSFSEYD